MRFRQAAAAVTLAVALSASGSLTARAETGVIRAEMGGDVGSLDPVWTTADLTREASFLVYDMLSGLDADGNPQPQMVDTYQKSDDDLVYTFTLRDGLKFHDDTPVKAADVVASWKRWAEKDARGQMIGRFLSKIEALDDKSFRVTLSKPFGQLIPAISTPFPMPLFILPERLASKSGDEELKKIVGSGPYKFEADQWVPGSKAVFTKFDGYVPRSDPTSGTAGAKIAKTPKVVWAVFNDAQTSASALINDEIDVIYQPSSDVLPTLKASPDVDVYKTDAFGVIGITRLNHLNPPFDNPAIRRAMQYFINQRDIIQAVTGSADGGIVCGAILVCGSTEASEFGADNLISKKSQDERNKEGMQALKEAGYKGEEIVILYPQEQAIQGPATLVIADAMQRAGMNVKLEPMDWATVRQRRTVKHGGPGGWHIFLTYGGGLSSADPAFHIPVSAACDDAWFGWPCDKEMERLREAWVTENDPAKCHKIAEDIQRRAMEISVFLPFGQIFTYQAKRKELVDVPKTPESLVFWNARVTE